MYMTLQLMASLGDYLKDCVTQGSTLTVDGHTV